ncbi:MAG TPA: hypothetical protein VKB12_11985 [Pyrinomonadaceae bacterium]|nr:hypothetical protein [Pyrinomonadaceae bacterium]
MINRRFILPAFAALALAALLSPSTANAQGSIWDRIRDRAEQERDRDNGRGGRRRDDDDRYGRRGGRISDNERRQLRELARRIDDRSRDLQRDIDRSLDHSRVNGTRREDNINQEARKLRNAAGRFRNVAGDSNDLYRSSDEARQLLEQASQISRMLGRARIDSRTGGNWNQLRNDLRTVADIYNLRFNDGGGYYGNDDGGWRRGRRDN